MENVRRYDAWLLLDVVKPTSDFVYERDYNAICEFSDGYDLPLDISVWA